MVKREKKNIIIFMTLLRIKSHKNYANVGHAQTEIQVITLITIICICDMVLIWCSVYVQMQIECYEHKSFAENVETIRCEKCG